MSRSRNAGVAHPATASQRAQTVLSLDNPASRQALVSNFDLITQVPTPVLVDEWQLEPPVWDRVRSLLMRPLSFSERGLVEPTVSLRTLLDGLRPEIGGVSPMTVPEYLEEILRS